MHNRASKIHFIYRSPTYTNDIIHLLKSKIRKLEVEPNQDNHIIKRLETLEKQYHTQLFLETSIDKLRSKIDKLEQQISKGSWNSTEPQKQLLVPKDSDDSKNNLNILKRDLQN